MIALRGTVRHVPKKKSTHALSQPGTIDGEINFDPNLTHEGEWIWTGHWAFGSLPDEKLHTLSQRKKKPPSGVRPFVYKFHRKSNASDIIVPSSLLASDDGGDEDDKNSTKDEASYKDSAQEKLLFNGTGGEENDPKPFKENVCSSEESNSVAGKPDKRDDNSIDITLKDKASIIESDNSMNMNLPMKSTSGECDEEVTAPQIKLVSIPVDNKKAIVVDQSRSVHNNKDSVSDECNFSLTEKQNGRNHHTNQQGSKTTCKELTKEIAHEKLACSFAFDGKKYTDAGLEAHPKKCPVGGCWKGYFENVSRRKDRMTSRVQESFHLFFNSTPPCDARMVFDLDENQDDRDDFSKSAQSSGALQPNWIHVRGAGTNQFGTFEIVGGYNLENNVLSCQRIYISTTDGPGEKSGNLSKEKKVATTSIPMRKSYFTRKRPVSLKKRGYTGDNMNADIAAGAKGRPSGGGKKRLRASEPNTRSQEEYASKNLSSAIPMNVSTTNSAPDALSKESSMQATVPIPEIKDQSILRRPSPEKMTPTGKKTKTFFQSSCKSSSTGYITIPKAGNLLDARWRSAHFLYYHRQTDVMETTSASPSTNIPASVTPTKTNYVVYEGEMNIGNNIRDGKGICLYNNNMIYEGEWKRNKEHGYGSLFTGDRNKTIYVGEWERGKMHGRGAYYYHMFTNEMDLGNVAKYDGEFKENSRHGLGTLTFADGSIYEGEWRDNVPCGRGVFRWKDKSIYNGNWKDGKRNGIGKLEAIDGFIYDGIWVENAMEGKGHAIYPNGQQYNGMWLNGKREGRGTIIFGNGAVYKGRFKEDCMEGQGTLKIERNVTVPQIEGGHVNGVLGLLGGNIELKDDWMIPIEFQSDIGHIHQKAGFTKGGE